MHARERGLYFDDANGRQVDLFIDAFRMCHEIPLGDRLEVETGTVPLAELMLTKLQIIELNEKDIRDTVLLLHGHDVADHDDDAVNAQAGPCRTCFDSSLTLPSGPAESVPTLERTSAGIRRWRSALTTSPAGPRSSDSTLSSAHWEGLSRRVQLDAGAASPADGGARPKRRGRCLPPRRRNQRP